MVDNPRRDVGMSDARDRRLAMLSRRFGAACRRGDAQQSRRGCSRRRGGGVRRGERDEGARWMGVVSMLIMAVVCGVWCVVVR